MSLTTLFNESLIKLAMNGVLVLSLLPMLNGGMGLNFGLSVGITSGLVGMCIGINMRLSGLVGFFRMCNFCHSSCMYNRDCLWEIDYSIKRS